MTRLSTPGIGSGRSARRNRSGRRSACCQSIGERRHRLPGALGAGPDHRHHSSQRVEPEIVALPPDHLIKQIRLDTAVRRCAHQHREPDLAMFATQDLPFRQVPIQEPLVGDRPLPLYASQIQRVARNAQKHLARERVVARMKILDSGGERRQILATRQTGEQPSDRFRLVETFAP